MDLHELSQGVKDRGESDEQRPQRGIGSRDGWTSKPRDRDQEAGRPDTRHAPRKTEAPPSARTGNRRPIQSEEKLSKDIEALNAKIKEQLNQSTKLAGKPGKEKQVADLEQKADDLQQKVTNFAASIRASL